MKQKLIYFSLFAVCFILNLTAQSKVEGLVISEVYLNEKMPAENWIEIYNPTNEPLTMSCFAISTFLTPNLLQRKDIVVNKNEYVIISASENYKIKKKKNNDIIIVMKELQMIDKGGLITIGTIEKNINFYDTIKYGNDVYSNEIKEYVNKKLVPFSKNNKSFSRKMDKSVLYQSEYYETDVTPLEKNK